MTAGAPRPRSRRIADAARGQPVEGLGSGEGGPPTPYGPPPAPGDQAQAAYPSTFAPSRVAVGVGRQPRASRAANSSGSVGRWSQTATAVKLPNQDVS